MGINQTWCVIPIIFVSTASIHDARLFDIYDVRSPFLSEVHAIPPSCFVPSGVFRWGDHCAMPPVSPAIIHLAGVALVDHIICHCCCVSTQHATCARHHPTLSHTPALTAPLPAIQPSTMWPTPRPLPFQSSSTRRNLDAHTHPLMLPSISNTSWVPEPEMGLIDKLTSEHQIRDNSLSFTMTVHMANRGLCMLSFIMAKFQIKQPQFKLYHTLQNNT